MLQWLVWRKHFDWRIWGSLVPIVGGILLTSITELSFDIFGFCAALFGCLATSTKTILAESLLHGYKFDRYFIFSWTLIMYCTLKLVVTNAINNGRFYIRSYYFGFSYLECASSTKNQF